MNPRGVNIDAMREAWERQHGEPPKAAHAFCHYRDLGELRSIGKAWEHSRGAVILAG